MDGSNPGSHLIGGVRAAASISELSSLCEMAGHALGFTYYTVLQPAMAGTPVSGLLLTNYPVDWIKQAVKNYNYLNSPVISLAAQSTMPFEWSELPQRLKLTSGQQAYLRQIARMGIRSGFTVPVQSRSDPPGMVSFVSTQPRELDDQTKAITMFLAMTVFHRAKDLQKLRRPPALVQDAITDEVVKLMLRGRSLRFIAEKLNIPPRELEACVEKASRNFPEGSNIALVARILYAPRKRTRAASAAA